MPVYALSIHADYKCQRSGVCCTSDWDVPVDVPLYRTLTDADAAKVRERIVKKLQEDLGAVLRA